MLSLRLTSHWVSDRGRVEEASEAPDGALPCWACCIWLRRPRRARQITTHWHCRERTCRLRVDEDGAYVGLLSREEVLALPAYPGDKGAPLPEGSPYYEYVSLPDCPVNHPERDQEIMCGQALKQCPPELEGNTRLRIWRQLVTPPDDRGPWEAAGVTCYSDVAPGARPRLTMADLKAAFMRTPWAKPTITTQPKGDVTLVNLDTFYRVTWSGAGFEPDETDRRVLRGIPVSIRPKLVGFTYHFGDGETYGPTDSLGGVYPDGDVVHTYLRPGEFTTRVTTTIRRRLQPRRGSDLG